MRKLLFTLLLLCGSALAQSTHAVTLNWTWSQGTGPANTGFRVYRATVAGGPYTLKASLTDPAIRTYEDLSAVGNVLVEGTRYFYVVTTTGTGGSESVSSNEVSAVIPFLPAAPTLQVPTVR